MQAKTPRAFSSLTAAGLKAIARILLAALAFGSGDLLAQQPNVSASQTDAFPSHPDNREREGDTITYTTAISNATGTKVLGFWAQHLTRFLTLPVPATNSNSLVAVVKHSFKPTTALL